MQPQQQVPAAAPDVLAEAEAMLPGSTTEPLAAPAGGMIMPAAAGPYTVESVQPQGAAAEIVSSANLQKTQTLRPWEGGVLSTQFLNARDKAVAGHPAELRNISVDVVNQDKEAAIARVIGMASGHDLDTNAKYQSVEVREVDVQGILRPEEKLLAQLPVKIFEGFPQADDSGVEEDVSGNCALALIEVEDETDANPLNKRKPKGPQTLVFMYTGEVEHTIRGSGHEVCKGVTGCAALCCKEIESHSYTMTRRQSSGAPATRCHCSCCCSCSCSCSCSC